MNDSSKISIITPVHNAQDFIERCILSVVKQEHKNIEHLIIDGGSNDNTLQIVRKYSETYSHIKYISQKDDGIYDAMNKGIDMASGEWIYFIGADDMFFDERVLSEIFYSTEKYKQFDIIYGNVGWGSKQIIYRGEFTKLQLMFKNVCHQAMFFKKDILRLVGGYDVNYKLMADWILNMRFFNDDDIKIKYINKNIALYNIEGASVNLKDEKFLENKRNILSVYFPKSYLQFFDMFNKLNGAMKRGYRDAKLQSEYEDVFIEMLLEKQKEIEEMKASKFWKIRNAYMKYRGVIGDEAKKNVKDDKRKCNKIQLIPHYLDPITVFDNSELNSATLAVHLHLSGELTDRCIEFLKQIPVNFDIFISIEMDELEADVLKNIDKLQKITIQRVPQNCEHIAPFIVQFGQQLEMYDNICHIDSDSIKSCNKAFDTKDKIHQILILLRKEIKIIYFADDDNIVVKKKNEYNTSELFLDRYFNKSVCYFQNIDFPQNGIFWAKTGQIKQLLNLNLTYDDFENNKKLLTSNNIINALLPLTLESAGKYYCIYTEDTVCGKKYFEDQKDYSDNISQEAPRILSYYLPQFNAIPENDEWHEKGFTEWYKVRRANPIFEGHYQQHVPHSDIGYYSLDSTEMLQKQANMMKKSGVYGQIFYHYWFSGKLILEKPAQLLLANKNIDMPFCFCWANENWTKKWQGNEKEILLNQKYSKEDAKQFIEYLIPFLKDKRYITIEDRPVLFVYQMAAIQNFAEYKDIWKQCCEDNGIKEFYIVAVLNRDTISPVEYSVDAGVERVLHNWMDGQVNDIKDSLIPYKSIKPKVFKYKDIANFYSNGNDEKKYTYFRSLVPSWDNTPRYHEGAHIIHQSNPEEFQKWLNKIIQYTKSTLEKEEQIIVINAWNEWAEGAHLEPDERFGYGYLNSIGRALCDIDVANAKN